MMRSSHGGGGSTRVEAEGYALQVRAIAGVESCCYVESVDVAFDMGCCVHQAANKTHVFITHGHADHVSAFATHAARRSLQRMKPAKYYVPAHLVVYMQSIMNSYSAMQEDEIQVEIVPVEPFEEVHISAQWMIKAFPTVHRVPSLGYILFRKQSKLKDEFIGLPGKEIAALKREGHEVTTAFMTPEIAYTGDTTSQIFESSSPLESQLGGDLLNVKMLITEVSNWNVCCATTDKPSQRRVAF